jgi:hypothetical protein
MPVRRVKGNEKIAATRGQVALERGPVVYALEGLDNKNAIFDIALPSSAAPKALHKPDLLGGVTVLEITGAQRVVRKEGGGFEEKPETITAIPYAFWNNRGLSAMTVWMGRDAENVRPVPAPTLSSKAKLTTSFARGGMDIRHINDQLIPRNATDGFAPNFDFWPHKGGMEWIAMEFEKPATVGSMVVSWFDDTGNGECRVPESWSLYYQDDAGAWKPVEQASGFPTRKTEPIEVKFKPVTTRAMRMEIQQPKDFSCGLYEWEVIPEK